MNLICNCIRAANCLMASLKAGTSNGSLALFFANIQVGRCTLKAVSCEHDGEIIR